MSISSSKYHYFGVGILNLRSMQRQTSFPVSYPTSCTCLFISLMFCLFFSLPEKSISILLGSCKSLNTPFISHLVWEVIQPSSRLSCPCSVCTDAPVGLQVGSSVPYMSIYAGTASSMGEQQGSPRNLLCTPP